MQRLEVSGAVRLIYRSLGVKGLRILCVCVCMYVCMYVCVYVYVCIYIYIYMVCLHTSTVCIIVSFIVAE